MLIQIFPHKLITIDKIVGGTEAVYDTAFPHIFYFGPGPFLCWYMTMLSYNISTKYIHKIDYLLMVCCWIGVDLMVLCRRADWWFFLWWCWVCIHHQIGCLCTGSMLWTDNAFWEVFLKFAWDLYTSNRSGDEYIPNTIIKRTTSQPYGTTPSNQHQSNKIPSMNILFYGYILWIYCMTT